MAVSCSAHAVPNRNGPTRAYLLALASKFKPDAVLVAAVVDYGYLKASKTLGALAALIISGCDTQWGGSARQRVTSVIAPRLVYEF